MYICVYLEVYIYIYMYDIVKDLAASSRVGSMSWAVGSSQAVATVPLSSQGQLPVTVSHWNT